MKKNTNALLLLLAFLLSCLMACRKDDLPDAPNPPEIALTRDTIIAVQGSIFTIDALLTDQVGLRSFNLRYDEWFLNNTISLQDSSNPATYRVQYKFRMPENAANKIHTIVLTGTNVGGIESTKEIVVMQDTDFPRMYLTDNKEAPAASTALFGVPMRVDKTGAYSYRALYYSEAAGTNIWFTPSKTDFERALYGKDPANSSKLIADPATAEPIVLNAKGYFSIAYNTLSLDYVVEQLPTPDPAGAFNQVAIAGQGFYDYPAMAWQNALPNIILLDKDPDNPYRFTKLVKLGIPPGQTYTEAQFIFTTNNGWTDFWRFDNGPNPEYTIPNDGANGGGFPITSAPVTYKVTFDTYINRSKFEKQ
ncbi:hypothetical protein [Flavihumibacter sp. UBA7668]|uniref:hypothetical protein n=1 Tax=Flavihumibacter sp. UBA7668 TaxID=1946542 RepID=UPI0025BF8DEF|nr:hypothetical protein [Flavihumibacter sp. UBA7668]